MNAVAPPLRLVPAEEVRLGGPLAKLSIARVDGIRGVGSVLSNAERMAALRPFLPVEFGNARFWRSEAEQYAAGESQPSDEDIAAAAAFHFHGEEA